MNRRTVLYALGALLLAGVLAMLFIPKGGGLPSPGPVTNAQLRELANQGATLVDVRTPGEYAAGHISGAANVPMSELTSASASWDRAKPVVVYCQTGSRSAVAASFLRAQGFKQVYDLTAGIEQWDGDVARGLDAGRSSAALKGPATALPVMYDFASAT